MLNDTDQRTARLISNLLQLSYGGRFSGLPSGESLKGTTLDLPSGEIGIVPAGTAVKPSVEFRGELSAKLIGLKPSFSTRQAVSPPSPMKIDFGTDTGALPLNV
jgi:hypothetical protein